MMRHVAIGMMLSLIIGCYTENVDVNFQNSHKKNIPKDEKFLLPGMAKNNYSLFCKNGEKARQKIELERFAYTYTKLRVYWEIEKKHPIFGGKASPYNIYQTCKRFIKKDSSQKMTFEEYQSFFRRKLNEEKSDYDSLPKDHLKLAFEKGHIVAEKINKKYCVICLEPLIVIVLDMENISWNSFFSFGCHSKGDWLFLRKSDGYFHKYDHQDAYHQMAFFDATNITNGLVFPDGLDFGLEMPYVENPRWFSPDMKVKDEPLNMVSEGKGRIEVPWGYLYLTKQEDKWVVTAEKK